MACNAEGAKNECKLEIREKKVDSSKNRVTKKEMLWKKVEKGECARKSKMEKKRENHGKVESRNINEYENTSWSKSEIRIRRVEIKEKRKS